MPLIAGAMVGGAALSYLGGRSANKGNEAQSAKSLAFQREMAKNAHQYEVADLRAAGLNPILSAGGPGARASGGAQANIKNPVPANLGSTLGSAAMMNKEMQLMDARIDDTNSAAALKRTQAKALGVPETIGTAATDASTLARETVKKGVEGFSALVKSAPTLHESGTGLIKNAATIDRKLKELRSSKDWNESEYQQIRGAAPPPPGWKPGYKRRKKTRRGYRWVK